MFHVPEKYRFKNHASPLASDESFGNNGAFFIPFESYILEVIASDGAGWEHVSVILKNRCPNWKEMCFIKSLFWDETDCVVQYHPPKAEYVNNHETCLHLWRSTTDIFPLPPSILVGIK